MDDSNITPKTAFISYSWDSEDHRQWVIRLATSLVSNGVNVLIDEWDLDLGDDVAKFMEQGVRDADRVLIVCSDEYVRKADAGIGGVGYEKMIVTGELVRNMGTKKFIPVIREGDNPDKLTPSFLATRLFCDFRDDDSFDQKLAELASSITHGTKITKPPLGKPEPKTPNDIAQDAVEKSNDTINSKDPTQVYHYAHALIEKGNMVAWRRLAQRLQKEFKSALHEWRQKHEPIVPPTDTPLIDQTNEAVDAIAPAIAMALAGVESGDDRVKDQRALFDELYYLTDWNRAGRVILTELPITLGFVYQALHGAIAIYTDQPILALDFATMMVRHHNETRKAQLWQHHDLVGWPKTLGGDCKVAWEYLSDAFNKWSWLQEIFGGIEEYKIALISYYVLLNFIEYSQTLRDGHLKNGQATETILLEVPIIFSQENRELVAKAMKRISKHPELFDAALKMFGQTRQEAIAGWDKWVPVCNSWLGKARYLFLSAPHAELMDYLGWK
jgi:hypothetical protein